MTNNNLFSLSCKSQALNRSGDMVRWKGIIIDSLWSNCLLVSFVIDSFIDSGS
jgi:hypothetical protein